MTFDELRTQARALLLAKDQPGLEVLLLTAGLAPLSAVEVERVVRAELAATPHEIHEWWDGPCNCTN